MLLISLDYISDEQYEIPGYAHNKQDAVGDGRLRPTAATSRTRRNTTLSLILAHWPHYPKNCRHPLNWKQAYKMYCTVIRRYRATATDNTYTYRKNGKIWKCGFEICRPKRTKRQTQTYTQIRWSQYFAHIPGRSKNASQRILENSPWHWVLWMKRPHVMTHERVMGTSVQHSSICSTCVSIVNVEAPPSLW